MRRLVAPLLATSLLLACAGVAAADEAAGPYSLDVFSCNLFDGNGELVEPAVIPAGSEVVLWEGWFATTHGQLLGFLNNVTWVLTVNGTAVDITPDLTGPIQFPFAWADLFFHTVTVGASGTTLDTLYDNVMKSANYDGVIHWARGSLYGGGVHCSIPVS
jgi:hypothetical protein